jgi:hypothetical protein
MGSFEEMAVSACEALIGAGEASDPEYVAVRTAEELERLCDDIYGERDYPIVGLTMRRESSEPILRASDIRGVVGPGVRIYLLTNEELLYEMQELVGSRAGLWSGAIRIWWPGVSARSDPGDHPLVVGLEDEDYTVTLEEFANEFDLSRPRVRNRMRLVYDSRAFLERQLHDSQGQNRRTHERLRDAQIECHRLRTRAEVAEAACLGALRPPAVSE